MVTPSYNFRQVILRAFDSISERLAVGMGTEAPDGSIIRSPATGIDAGNSTSTALLADATFTGDWFDVSNYATAGVLVFADQVSASLGVRFQLSDDGVNVREQDQYTIEASAGKIYTVPLIGRYFRVVYINGNTDQGDFALQVKLFAYSPKSSSHSINDAIIEQDDAELVKSVLTANDEDDGTFVNIKASGGRNLLVAIGQRLSEVRGRTPIQKSIEAVSLSPAGTVVHTVTAGRKFYLQSLIMSALNSANATGRIAVQDDAVVVVPFLLEGRNGTVPARLQASGIPLADPLEFTTNVKFVELAGNVIASATIIGYEEDI